MLITVRPAGRCSVYCLSVFVLARCARSVPAPRPARRSPSASLDLTLSAVTNEWVRNNAGLKRELLDTVKARKLAYYGHTLEKEIMHGTMPGARRRGRPRTAWMDNIKTWTGLSVEKSIRMTEDMDKWRKYVHGVANPGIEDG